MELTIYETIYLIVCLCLILCLFVVFVVFQLFYNSKKQKYLSTLNEHDKAAIFDYENNCKLSLKDFKKKKDK